MNTLKTTSLIVAALAALGGVTASADLFKLVPVADTELQGRSPDLHDRNTAPTSIPGTPTAIPRTTTRRC